MLADLHAVLAEWAWGDSPAAANAPGRGRGKPGNVLRAAADAARRTARQRALARKQRFQAALRQHNVQASFIERSPEDTKGSDWPPTRTMLVIAVHTITDWIHATKTITRLLQLDVIKTSDLGRDPLVIARFGDRPIPLTARKVLTTKLAPHYDDYVQVWGEALGEPFATPLLDLFLRFVKSLHAVSVLRTLHACRTEEHSDETNIRNHVELLKNTLTDLRSFPEDRVVATIIDSIRPLLAELQSELDDPSASLASQTLAAKMTDPNSEIHKEIEGLELLTLAWSISPASAAQWLSTVQVEQHAGSPPTTRLPSP